MNGKTTGSRAGVSGAIKRFTVKHKTVIILLAVNVAALYRWFFSFSTLTWGDWPYRMDVFEKGLFSLPFVWGPSNGALGCAQSAPSFYPVNLMEGLLARLGLGYAVIERINFMWPIVIVGALGSYYLVRKVTGSEIAAFVGSIVYTFNSYSAVLRNSHLTILAGVALAPFIILLFMKTLEEKKWYLAVSTGVLCWIASVYEFRVLYVIFAVLILYFAYHVLVIDRPAWRPLGKQLILAVVPFAIVLLTNLYWILGLYKSGGITPGVIAARTLFGQQYLDIAGAATLHHPFWTLSKFESFAVHGIPAHYYLIPVVACLGLLVGRKNRRVLFFGLLALLGILFVKQQGAPFTGMYNWFYNNVPGFKFFREASKFYFVVALGYSVLIASFVCRLYERGSRIRWRTYAKYVVTGAIVLVFLVNAWPQVTGAAGSMFVSRSVPSDYLVLKDHILGQKEYSRTLWVPIDTPWITVTDNETSIGYWRMAEGGDVAYGNWKAFSDALQADSGQTTRDRVTSLFFEKYFPDLLGIASVKYVVVPKEDKENDNDVFGSYGGSRSYYLEKLDSLPYLKKLDIGTREVAVYEFEDFRPYCGALTELFKLRGLDWLGSKRDFARNVLGKGFAFAVDPNTGRRVLADLAGLFERISRNDIDTTARTISDRVNAGGSGKADTTYESRDRTRLTYELSGDRLNVYAYRPADLFSNGLPVTFTTESRRALGGFTAGPASGYCFVSDSTVLPVEAGGERSVGLFGPDQGIELFSYDRGANLAPDGSIQQGRWRRSIPVEPGGEYLLSLEYQSPYSSVAEYDIAFNDGSKPIVRSIFLVEDDKWHGYSSVIKVPRGATRLELRTRALSGIDERNVSVRYRDIGVRKLRALLEFAEGDSGSFDSTGRVPQRGPDDFVFRDPYYALENIVPNGSFEKGLWKARVGDFNNYDNHPILGMRLVERSAAGGKCLQLEATRHIAETSQSAVGIKPGSYYLFSFDYQGPNATEVKCQITFDNPEKTRLEETIPVTDREWHSFNKVIRAPRGAYTATIHLLGDSKDEKTKIITRYDNVSLVEIPDFAGWYYYVSDPRSNLSPPASVTFDNVNPTRKRIHVKGATTAFFLSMAESYHPGWKLMLDNAKVKGPLKSWLPVVAKPDLVEEKYHYKLDDVTNAWYVDTPELAEDGLIEPNPDGTCDMELVAEFWPQRYCYAGFVVSVMTLLGCLGYLLVVGVIAWRRRRGDNP